MRVMVGGRLAPCILAGAFKKDKDKIIEVTVWSPTEGIHKVAPDLLFKNNGEQPIDLRIIIEEDKERIVSFD